MPPIAVVPGATLAYDVAGPVDSPAVLFVHAGVATRAMWDPQFDDLARDHRVIRYDTRGYGESPGDPVEYSESDDLIRVLDDAQVDHAVIVGSSRGGRFALDAALAQPDRVCGLVLVGSRPSGYLPGDDEWTDAELDIRAAIDTALDAGDLDALVRLEVQLYDVGPERDVDIVDAAFVQRAIELNVGAVHFDFAGTALEPERPAVDRLSEIAVPTLVVVGEHDVSVARTAAGLLLEGIPGAEQERFADAAHLPSVEHPTRFTRIVRDWLARHPHASTPGHEPSSHKHLK